MSEQDVIKRLNELYRLSQQKPLSEAELAERDQFRRKYLAMIRGQVQTSLERYKPHPENTPHCEHKDTGCGCGCGCGHDHEHGHHHH